ncbi:MAG: response regulator [Deltaproteobacteria bacterium]|nr:response regulator [Deltaproteobacteria bacterium]
MVEKILVVDDEKMILDLASLVLESRGYQAIRARDGESALNLVEKESPQLVLLDYMLPGMDGMRVLRTIREKYPKTYVVMLTGKGSEEIAVELMKAGASDYILKPFKSRDLLERIGNVLKIRRIELNNQELRREKERLLKEIEKWNLELEKRIEEKTRDLEKAQREIFQAEKMAALGHLIAGMAHEIRNPLNSVTLFVQVLKPSLEDKPEESEILDRILQEIDRIDSILIRLLATSKRSQFSPEKVLVTEVINLVLKSLDDNLRTHRVEVKKDFQTIPPAILADPTEIEQIFSNLFVNSIFEMQKGGKLEIRVTHDANMIDILVADTGKGIPPENFTKIFDPFFTTKEKGTGFGLSVVLRIVKSYGGHISVESRDEPGAVFHIEIPLKKEGEESLFGS